MEPQEQRKTDKPPKLEFFDPSLLRPHPLHRFIPSPKPDSADWHAFVDALSGVGPEDAPPIYVTEEWFIMDGERRWRAARQLQWKQIPCIVRPDWEAPLLIVESLMGQRCLTKGAKAYLSQPLLSDYSESAEKRRLLCLQKGVKSLQKPLIFPLPHSVRNGTCSAQLLAGRFGVAERTMEQAIQISKAFKLEHKFEFQDGSTKTLKEHFEPLILDPEHPMGLGDVIKGIGWFVGSDGKPLNHPPPARNSHVRYFQCAWENLGKRFANYWEGMSEQERSHVMEAAKENLQAWPTEAKREISVLIKNELKRERKAAARAKSKNTKVSSS